MSKESGDRSSQFFGFFAALALSPILFLFIHYRQADLGRMVGAVLLGILFAVRKQWDLKEEIWFWAVVIAAVFAQMVTVCSLPSLHGWIPGAGLMPIALAGYLLTTGAITLARNFMMPGEADDLEKK
jgi:hypothetical protein